MSTFTHVHGIKLLWIMSILLLPISPTITDTYNTCNSHHFTTLSSQSRLALGTFPSHHLFHSNILSLTYPTVPPWFSQHLPTLGTTHINQSTYQSASIWDVERSQCEKMKTPMAHSRSNPDYWSCEPIFSSVYLTYRQRELSWVTWHSLNIHGCLEKGWVR